MSEKDQHLDIFKVLGNADVKYRDFYSSLSETEQKQFAPFLAMRWLSGTSSPLQVYMINEVINQYAFSLFAHKQLLWNLLTVATSGKKQKYSWIKAPNKASSSKPMATKILQQYYGYSSKHASEAANVLSKDQIIAIADELGIQADDMAKLKREYKNTAKDAQSELVSKVFDC